MKVLAIDGGERCGWARSDIAEDGGWSDLRHGITPLRDFALALFDHVEDYDCIVLEEWRLYPHMTSQFAGSSFPTVQFNGMVKLLCWKHGTKLVMQGAAVKKPALAMMAKFDPALHAKVTRSGAHDDLHDMDALIHLWRYTERNFDLTPKALEAA